MHLLRSVAVKLLVELVQVEPLELVIEGDACVERECACAMGKSLTAVMVEGSYKNGGLPHCGIL